MSRNKAEAISKAKNEWCILFDSDNILYPEYLDSLLSIFNPKIIYCPEFAEPDFDFSNLPEFITKDNAKENLNEKMFRVFLNCCNYVVNRDEYLRVYEHDISVKESDTIHFNYLWLKAENEFYFVPGMKYFHLKHKDSGWLQNHKENIQKANEIIEKIKLL
jgi:glycosyltransferase involved in cell wall biosynthesis